MQVTHWRTLTVHHDELENTLFGPCASEATHAPCRDSIGLQLRCGKFLPRNAS